MGCLLGQSNQSYFIEINLIFVLINTNGSTLEVEHEDQKEHCVLAN